MRGFHEKNCVVQWQNVSSPVVILPLTEPCSYGGSIPSESFSYAFALR